MTGQPSLEVVNRDAEQTHMSLGVRVPGRHWKQRWALSVLNTALGGGLSSRLFQQIRETRGLAYSVYSTVDTFSDTGALSVYAACLPERFAEVTRVTTDVLETVARDGINEAECRIAKGSLCGGLVLGLLVWLVFRPMVGGAARARGDAAEHGLREVVSDVLAKQVVSPTNGVLASYSAFRSGIAHAQQ